MSIGMVLYLKEGVIMRSLSETRFLYPDTYNFSLDCYDKSAKENIIYAPVKSGKRGICETISQYTNKGKIILNIFVSGLNRRDVKVQFEELREYGLACYVSLEITKHKHQILDKINQYSQKGYEVVIHIDEADYGSESTQILGSFIRDIHNIPNVKLFFYTATPWELTSAPKFMGNAKIFRFTPNENYRGAKWFLDNNLVHETLEDFVEFDENGKIIISKSGIEWCKNWVSNSDKSKNISVVRISTRTNESADGITSKFKILKNSFIKKKELSATQKQIAEIFPEKLFCPIFVDEKTEFHFGDYDSWDGIKNSTHHQDQNTYHLIFINQTSTRSTEWGFHDRLYFYYSFESAKANVTTQIQRQQRVAHYHKEGYPINVITSDVDTWLVSASKMSIEDYVLIDPKNRSVHQRTSKTDNRRKLQRYFVYEGDPYVTVSEPEGLRKHCKLTIHKDHPLLVERRNHPGMIEPNMADGTILDLRGQDLEFGWTNVVSTHGLKSKTANANVARYVLEGKFGLSKGWHHACALLDKASPAIFNNENCPQSWEDLLKKYKELKDYVEDPKNPGFTMNGGKFKKRVFAVYLPAMEQIEEPFVVATKNKSVYSQIPKELLVEA